MGEPRHTLTDPAQIRALAMGRGAEFIAPFAHRDASIAEAAAELGEPITKVHYWAKRLESLGLVRCVEVRPRAGRAIKRYRAIASTFHIPAASLPLSHFERSEDERIRQMRDDLAAEAPGAVRGGDLWVIIEADNTVSIDRVGSGDSPNPAAWRGAMTTWRTLYLTTDQATQVKSELASLLTRYTAQYGQPSADAREHVLHVEYAPRSTGNPRQTRK